MRVMMNLLTIWNTRLNNALFSILTFRNEQWKLGSNTGFTVSTAKRSITGLLKAINGLYVSVLKTPYQTFHHHAKYFINAKACYQRTNDSTEVENHNSLRNCYTG